MSLEVAVIRVIFVIFFTGASYQLRPFHLSCWSAALVGAVLGVFFVVFEMRLEYTSLKRLIGAAVGSLLGILVALMLSNMLTYTAVGPGPAPFLQAAFLLLLGYIGLVL